MFFSATIGSRDEAPRTRSQDTREKGGANAKGSVPSDPVGWENDDRARTARCIIEKMELTSFLMRHLTVSASDRRRSRLHGNSRLLELDHDPRRERQRSRGKEGGDVQVVCSLGSSKRGRFVRPGLPLWRTPRPADIFVCQIPVSATHSVGP